MNHKPKAEIATKSVYAEIGFKDHKEIETKANLVIEIRRAMNNKKLTQTKAAEIIGLSQPKLSELLRGHFRGYSIERLIHFLNKLGKDVDIVIKPKSSLRRARVTVYHSNSEIHPRA